MDCTPSLYISSIVLFHSLILMSGARAHTVYSRCAIGPRIRTDGDLCVVTITRREVMLVRSRQLKTRHSLSQFARLVLTAFSFLFYS